MIITEERVNISQIDELSERLFKVKGKINLDKNDLAWILAGSDDCTLISARHENEESCEFVTKFVTYLAAKPNLKNWKRLMLKFGYSQEHPLKMEDISIINEILFQKIDEFDIIWGLHENPDEIGLSADIIINTEQ